VSVDNTDPPDAFAVAVDTWQEFNLTVVNSSALDTVSLWTNSSGSWVIANITVNPIEGVNRFDFFLGVVGVHGWGGLANLSDGTSNRSVLNFTISVTTTTIPPFVVFFEVNQTDAVQGFDLLAELIIDNGTNPHGVIGLKGNGSTLNLSSVYVNSSSNFLSVNTDSLLGNISMVGLVNDSFGNLNWSNTTAGSDVWVYFVLPTSTTSSSTTSSSSSSTTSSSTSSSSTSSSTTTSSSSIPPFPVDFESNIQPIVFSFGSNFTTVRIIVVNVSGGKIHDRYFPSSTPRMVDVFYLSGINSSYGQVVNYSIQANVSGVMVWADTYNNTAGYFGRGGISLNDIVGWFGLPFWMSEAGSIMSNASINGGNVNVTGTFRSGSGDDFFRVNGSGFVGLVGGGRVIKHLQSIGELGKGHSAPSVNFDEAPYVSYTYDINDDSHITFEIPGDMDFTVASVIKVHWYTSDAGQTGDEVNWQASWVAKAPGEAINSGSTNDSSGDINCLDQWIMAETVVEIIPANSIAAGDIVGLEFARIDIVGGSDPNMGSVHVLSVELEYTANKLGGGL
jgi:hypothetical protein